VDEIPALLEYVNNFLIFFYIYIDNLNLITIDNV